MEISKTAFKEYARCLRCSPGTVISAKAGRGKFFNDEQKEKMANFSRKCFPRRMARICLPGRKRRAGSDARLLWGKWKDGRWFARKNNSGVPLHTIGKRRNRNASASRILTETLITCHLDGYSEGKNGYIVIEVKATTSHGNFGIGTENIGETRAPFPEGKQYLQAGGNRTPIYWKDRQAFPKIVRSLFRRGALCFRPCGGEVYCRKQHPPKPSPSQGKKFQYYLAVLNSDYVFLRGIRKGDSEIHNFGDDSLVSFIDLTAVSKEFSLWSIKSGRTSAGSSNTPVLKPQKIGSYCDFGKRHSCLFTKSAFRNCTKKARWPNTWISAD